MKAVELQVRHWWVDHWGDWLPADRSTLASLSPSDWTDLRRGDTLCRHGGHQQIRRLFSHHSPPHPAPTTTTTPDLSP